MQSQSRIRTLSLIAFAAAALAVGAPARAGIPEPGITLYGNVSDGAARVTSGQLVWTYVPQAGGNPVIVTVELEDLDGELSYVAHLPAESPIVDSPVSANTLDASVAVTFTRSAAIDGVGATIVAAGAMTQDATFGPSERGKIERVDLSFIRPVSITQQPASQSVREGQPVALTVEAEGSPTIGYQWYRGTTMLPGATTNRYDIASVAMSDAGAYRCDLTNPGGMVSTIDATLAVLSASEPNGAIVQSHTLPERMLFGQSAAVTVNVDNTSNLTWSEAQGYRLGITQDTGNLYLGSTRLSLEPGEVIANQAAGGSAEFIGIATAPAAPGNFVVSYQMLEENVETFGNVVNANVEVAASFNLASGNFDFTGGDAQGWIGGALPGLGGSTSVGASGLCMFVPLTGTNDVLWVSPASLIELTDNTVYRARVTAATDQSAADAIPLWFFIYDNFSPTGDGNNIGGQSWVLDVDGGAQGIGRTNGRTSYDFWFAPNSIALPQWRSNADPNSAFHPSADAVNDIRFIFRVIDANPSLLTDFDSGNVCISSISVDAFSRDALAPTTVFEAPISSAIYAAGAFGEEAFGQASVNDAENNARFAVNTAGSARKTLVYFDAAQPDLNSQLYPVIWEGDALYRVRAGIRAEASESDPIDSIFLSMDTPTIELGTSQYSLSRAGSVMRHAASPRIASSSYEAYFYGQNATASVQPNANRVRPLLFFFNTTVLFGDGNGGDPLIVDSVAIDRLAIP